LIALNRQSHHFYKIAEGKLRKLVKYTGWQITHLYSMSGIVRVQSTNFFQTTIIVPPVEGKVNSKIDG